MKKYNKRNKVPRRRKKKRLTYKQYSQKCRFKFEVCNYPNEFDLSLLDEVGWYNKENPNGISRDHMLSVSYGWKRDIPPKILSHPANCQLMKYNENHDKGWRSSINYNELLKRIKQWNNKYKEKSL